MKKSARNSPEVRAVSLLTSRAGILSVVILAMLLSLAIPIKQLIDQQTRINELGQQQAANQALIKQLETRLHYVMPREVGYIVLEADDVNSVSAATQVASTSGRAWYTTMWNSLEDAGDTAPPLLVSVSD